MESVTPSPSLTEKHNAMISYCFMAPFMLLSRQEQFTSRFVRSHARYAMLLHIGFLALIIALIRSRNFSTVILYDMTWVHAVLFVLFSSLLVLLWNGLHKALKWEQPRIAFSSFSLKNIEKEFTTEVSVTEDEKTPLILSHIPFFGIYLAAKYDGKLAQGEKFGNWLCIAAMLSLWIDPSLTVFVAIIVLSTFWLVYQLVWPSSKATIHLVGQRFWTGQEIHDYLQWVWLYTKDLMSHQQHLPSGEQIRLLAQNRRKTYVLEWTPLIYLPIINLLALVRARKNAGIRFHIVQGWIITLIAVYSLAAGSVVLGVLACLAGFWGYIQTLFHKDANIPLIGEATLAVMHLLDWEKKRSTPETTHFTTHT